jgi:hypothetical protein
MRTTSLAATVVLLALGSVAWAGPLLGSAARCQRQIGRDGQRFASTREKAWRGCLEALLKGRACDPAARDATILRARTRLVANIARRCPAQLLFGTQPNGVGFTAGSCDLDPTATGAEAEACRQMAVSSVAESVGCLLCWRSLELDRLLRMAYPCLPADVPGTPALVCGAPASCELAGDEITCSASIARAAIDYALAREAAIDGCLDGVRQGQVPGPCPDIRTQALLAAAEQRKLATISRCRFRPPGWDPCPLDASGSCAERTASLSDVAACVDRGVDALVDRLACRDYPNAAADGVACPSGPPETTTTTSTTTSSTTTAPSSTTSSSTTSTTMAPQPIGCCNIGPSACAWLPPDVCTGPTFNGTTGPPGSVCDSATGTCTTAPATAGNCCTLTAESPPAFSFCIVSPLITNDTQCLTVGELIGPFTSATVITGVCPSSGTGCVP